MYEKSRMNWISDRPLAWRARGMVTVIVLLVGCSNASAGLLTTNFVLRLQSRVNTLTNTVEAQATEIAAAEEALSAAQTDIETLQNGLASAIAQIQNLIAENQTQGQALAQAQADLGTLSGQIQTQQQQIQNLTTENQNQDQAIAAVAASITKEVRAFVYSNRGVGLDFVYINPAPLNNPGTSVVVESTGVFLVTLEGPAGWFPNATEAVAVATAEVAAGVPGSTHPGRVATVAYVSSTNTRVQYRVRLHDSTGAPITDAFNLVILTRD
jgi:outer membrane murein-binding lipoprotein Lpp